ncbi:Hypothetical predicted protein [Mytilus galloprovincialis]|uniref:Uncharacterized protein n=1 Tax=Mytilus galloprovincialis TaxID=29158 RepID=A0A8B6FDY9_MYTGA|nr:Hypothetical predicted protein [Mytilus galloprovincialis]
MKRVTDLGRYAFTCRNGVALPNTVVNCSDDGLRLEVRKIHNESSCNCKDSMKSFSTDSLTETTMTMASTIEMESTIETTNHSSYTYVAVLISGMVTSIMLITALRALRMFIDTTNRIKHVTINFLYKTRIYLHVYIHFEPPEKRLKPNNCYRALQSSTKTKDWATQPQTKSESDLTDTEQNSTISDGIRLINTLYCNGQMDKQYSNIPPKSHMNIINDGVDFIKTQKCNEKMNKEYSNIPPNSHMTQASFFNIPYTDHIMVLERN